MMEDEQRPKQAIDVETLSVAELQHRIEALKADIEACEAELKRKASHLDSANSLFGNMD